jgi:protein-tyrosine phosphatase
MVCTANQCRSPLAAAVLGRLVGDRGEDVTVTSAGLLEGGAPAAPGMVEAAAVRGIDLSGHVSRTLGAAAVEQADLVVAMARDHVREIVSVTPSAFGRTFTLREAVRRGSEVGPRRPGAALAEWLGALHQGRRYQDLVGWTDEDDIADPMGGPPEAYLVAVTAITELTTSLADLAFPAPT